MASNLDFLEKNDPFIFQAIKNEEKRQKLGIELIPSENYTYPEVLAALGTVFTNKYSEGYPGRRYYGGQDYTDQVETLACERAKELFRCEHANVQPLSGSPMNQAVYLGLLEPGDKILAMDLSHGGHLTHGAPVSHMGKLFNFIRYKTNPVDGSIDFDQLRDTSLKEKPKLILCGYTSYPKEIDYAAFKKIADEVNAVTMADIAHIGGLVAGDAMINPFDHGFDIVTTTVHKTLRGPRSGMVLSKKRFAAALDKSVFPGLQGGPHMNTIAATAITLLKAAQPDFKEYAHQTLKNAKALASIFIQNSIKLITGGTENHMMVINTVESFGLDGKTVEETLDKISITTNKQIIPDDPNPPLKPSGIRLGTPAATTRGMKEIHMPLLAGWIIKSLNNHDKPKVLDEIKQEVESFCSEFPIPGIED